MKILISYKVSPKHHINSFIQENSDRAFQIVIYLHCPKSPNINKIFNTYVAKHEMILAIKN